MSWEEKPKYYCNESNPFPNLSSGDQKRQLINKEKKPL